MAAAGYPPDLRARLHNQKAQLDWTNRFDHQIPSDAIRWFHVARRCLVDSWPLLSQCFFLHSNRQKTSSQKAYWSVFLSWFNVNRLISPLEMHLKCIWKHVGNWAEFTLWIYTVNSNLFLHQTSIFRVTFRKIRKTRRTSWRAAT